MITEATMAKEIMEPEKSAGKSGPKRGGDLPHPETPKEKGTSLQKRGTTPRGTRMWSFRQRRKLRQNGGGRKPEPLCEPWLEEQQNAGLPPTAILFTGQETDPETGLICFPARYYSPTLSRWLTPDPAMDGDHWYGYCSYNPVGMVDPWGMNDTPANIQNLLRAMKEDKYRGSSSVTPNGGRAIQNQSVVQPQVDEAPAQPVRYQEDLQEATGIRDLCVATSNLMMYGTDVSFEQAVAAISKAREMTFEYDGEQIPIISQYGYVSSYYKFNKIIAEVAGLDYQFDVFVTNGTAEGFWGSEYPFAIMHVTGTRIKDGKNRPHGLLLVQEGKQEVDPTKGGYMQFWVEGTSVEVKTMYFNRY